MDAAQLEDNLQSIGKRCFVEYLHLFNDKALSNKEVVDALPFKSKKASQTRTSKARKIINTGCLNSALENIVNSPGVEAWARDKADRILGSLLP